MENRLSMTSRSGLFAAILGATILILGVLTVMAGFPPAEQMNAFIGGIIVLIVFTAAIGIVGWHLMLRPLPAGLQAIPQPLLTTRARQVIALLLTLGALSIGISAVWDEVWHSKYGIPFGEDFLWRPHMMLYFGLMSLIGVGLWSWWTVMTRGKGTLQQRFHANPLLGVGFLAGVFTVYSIGADPIWHSFYGADLAPWSLPHLLILVLVLFMSLVTIAYHKSLMPQREWQVKLHMTWRDMLIVLVMAGTMTAYIIVMVVQWYSATANSELMAQILVYPDWLIAAFIGFLAPLFGIIALHATRQIGSATMVGILTVVVRLALDVSLGAVVNGTYPLLLSLPLLVALDVWYAVSIMRTQKPPAFWTSAIAATVGYSVIGLPLQASLFPYPAVNMQTIPMLIIACLVSSLVGVWLGNVLGDLNRYGVEEKDKAPEAVKSTNPLLSQQSFIYVAYAAFVVIFVITAVPPA